MAHNHLLGIKLLCNPSAYTVFVIFAAILLHIGSGAGGEKQSKAKINPIPLPEFLAQATHSGHNPASVKHPSLGWITIARYDKCRHQASIVAGRRRQGCTFVRADTQPLVISLGTGTLPDYSLALNNTQVWTLGSSYIQYAKKSQAKHILAIDFRPFLWRSRIYAGHQLRLLWRASPGKDACWVRFNTEAIGCETMALARLDFETRQFHLAYVFREDLVPGLEESQLREKSWSFFEQNNLLFFFYSVFPCTRVFAFRPKETGGAVLQHQHCYGDIGESQKASRLQWNESHPSGTPAIWENNGRTEILLLVHNLDRVAFGWRQRHNWAVRVDRRTLRATHVSKGPILKSRAKPEGSGGVRGGVCDGRLSVGSYHVSGDRMRLMLGSEDKYSCWQDIDLGGITWQPLVPLEKVALEAFPVGESSLV